jgi:hypothetical protein
MELGCIEGKPVGLIDSERVNKVTRWKGVDLGAGEGKTLNRNGGSSEGSKKLRM